MPEQWFRSHHGAPFDPKWRIVARQAECRAGDVAAIWWGLLDLASQNISDRGRVWANANERGRTQPNATERKDRIAELAVSFDYDEELVERVVLAMESRRIISDGLLTAWSKRQPKREDSSAGRARAWRDARQRTQPNATERKRTQTRPEESTDANASVSDPKGSGVPPDDDPVKELFDTGIRILAASGIPPTKARGIVGKWRKSVPDDKLIGFIASAARATEPVAYVEGAIRKHNRPHGDALL